MSGYRCDCQMPRCSVCIAQNISTVTWCGGCIWTPYIGFLLRWHHKSSRGDESVGRRWLLRVDRLSRREIVTELNWGLNRKGRPSGRPVFTEPGTPAFGVIGLGGPPLPCHYGILHPSQWYEEKRRQEHAEEHVDPQERGIERSEPEANNQDTERPADGVFHAYMLAPCRATRKRARRPSE